MSEETGRDPLFTPVFDVIVQDPELGPMAALVFGRVWRYCQMEQQACFAGRDKMAEQIGLSERTFSEWLPKLVRAGYLEEVNGKAKYRKGCRYKDTGKVRLQVIATTRPASSAVNAELVRQ